MALPTNCRGKTNSALLAASKAINGPPGVCTERRASNLNSNLFLLFHHRRRWRLHIAGRGRFGSGTVWIATRRYHLGSEWNAFYSHWSRGGP